MDVPTLAVWKFASCDGCQLTLLDCEDELLAIASRVKIAHFVEASSEIQPGPYDVSLVEGSITTAADAERIRQVREMSRTLVSHGACAPRAASRPCVTSPTSRSYLVVTPGRTTSPGHGRLRSRARRDGEFEDYVIDDRSPPRRLIMPGSPGEAEHARPTARCTQRAVVVAGTAAPPAARAGDASRTAVSWSRRRGVYRGRGATAVRAIEPPAPGSQEGPLRAAVGHGATDAARGLLFHRYAIDAGGSSPPPGSGRLPRGMRPASKTTCAGSSLTGWTRRPAADLAVRAGDPHDDPCISCATHFLDLTVDRA